MTSSPAGSFLHRGRVPVHAVPGQGRHLPEAVEALLEARSDPDRVFGEDLHQVLW